MSYSLEDIINALNQKAQQEQRQKQAQQAYQSQRVPQYFVPSGFRGYPNVFTVPEDDDSDYGDYYQQRYPDYYQSLFENPYQQRYPGRAQYRQPQPEPAQEPQERSFPGGVNGLFELLNQLSAANEDSKDEDTPETENAEKEEVSPAAKGLVAPAKTSTEEKVKEPEAPKEKTQAVEQPSANLLKRHSTASFQEPKPKIEVSNRNFKNPTIPYSPQTNIYESNESYDIVVSLPGATIKDLDIDFHPSTNELVIKGTIPEITNIFGESLTNSTSKIGEIRTGSIERRYKFPNLPKIIDEQIKAKYINGLLVIKVPKDLETKKQSVKRKVTIEDVPDEELSYESRGGLV